MAMEGRTSGEAEQTDNASSNGGRKAKPPSPGPCDDSVSRLPSHLRSGYTSRLRWDTRTSWDGRARSPSPSPVRRGQLERPRSAISLPDHTRGRPTVLSDRWSYDHERMPSAPPRSRSPSPATPISSRPASVTPTESRPPSRPQSATADDDPCGTSFSYSASTPTLKVIPPPADSDGPADSPYPFHGPAPLSQTDGQHRREHRHKHDGDGDGDDDYHILTTAELEILAHPPPTSPPSRGSSKEPRDGGSSIHPDRRQVQEHTKSEKSRHRSSEIYGNGNGDGDHDGEGDARPGCLGLCELATVKSVGSNFCAWLMGIVIPVTSGLVTGCIAAATGGR